MTTPSRRNPASHEQLPRRTDRQARRPDQGGASSRCASSRSRACRAGSSCAPRSGTGIGLWLLEVTAGTLGFAWPNLKGGFGAPIKIGDLDDGQARRTRRCRSTRASRPTTRRRARSSSSYDPGQQQFLAGEDTTGDGTALNVRALYQRCPHLGCKPNPCLKNFWLECPCHGSRYDRLGIKADGAQYGPAPREHGPLLDQRRWLRAC